MRPRLFKTIVPVLLFNAPRADGKNVPQQSPSHGRGVDKCQIVGGAKSCWHAKILRNHAAPVHACGQEYEPGLMVNHNGFSSATARVATPGAHSRSTSSRA